VFASRAALQNCTLHNHLLLNADKNRGYDSLPLQWALINFIAQSAGHGLRQIARYPEAGTRGKDELIQIARDVITRGDTVHPFLIFARKKSAIIDQAIEKTRAT